MELLDEPVKIVAAMDDEGQVTPQKMTWQERRYPIVAVGRQWDEDDGRHVLVGVLRWGALRAAAIPAGFRLAGQEGVVGTVSGITRKYERTK
jgi:hypothetical protein